MNENIELSICIVSWNSSKELEECLNSIFTHTEGLKTEVIVFDNASSDNTLTMIKKGFPQVVLIENNKNIGFGLGNNKAIEKCRGNHILLLNPDMVITTHVLREMILFLDSHPEVGVTGCKLVNRDGSIQKSYFHEYPTPLNELLWGLMFHRIFGFSSTKETKNADVIEVAWLVGACMLFRRDVLIALHGFSEQYFMYGEDLDLCYRLRKTMNLKSCYLSNLEMLHHHGVSSNRQKKRYFSVVMQRESVYKFMKMHYGILKANLYRIVWIFSGLIRVAILIAGYLISMLMFNENKKRKILIALERYLRIVSWGFGLEAWAREQRRDN